MSTRNKLLKKLKNISVPSVSKPDIPTFEQSLPITAVREQFVQQLKAVGANVQLITTTQEQVQWIEALVGQSSYIDTLASDHSFLPLSEVENYQWVILQGHIGVAENGAIWVDDNSLPTRALTAICEKMIIVLPQSLIVQNMHLAYEMVCKKQYGYGVFIAGPSKTADIEQTLVKGAHGACELTVIIDISQ
ncbi:LutC/YkgG family protein [Algivirga pacifica]|uniref:LUD domain-containing protein n=1 Tax=Algivirga pacifica TaxID=1162670 RepID=A0ABP9DA62_9BACT